MSLKFQKISALSLVLSCSSFFSDFFWLAIPKSKSIRQCRIPDRKEQKRPPEQQTVTKNKYHQKISGELFRMKGPRVHPRCRPRHTMISMMKSGICIPFLFHREVRKGRSLKRRYLHTSLHPLQYGPCSYSYRSNYTSGQPFLRETARRPRRFCQEGYRSQPALHQDLW